MNVQLGKQWIYHIALTLQIQEQKYMQEAMKTAKIWTLLLLQQGQRPKPGQSRLDTLGASAKIMESVVGGVMASGFDGIFLLASNPVDIITYQVWKLSGLPRNRVIGTGTSLDSSRLRTILSEMLHVDPRSIHGYSLGEHGDSQMVAWSHVTVGGKPISQILEEQKNDLVK